MKQILICLVMCILYNAGAAVRLEELNGRGGEPDNHIAQAPLLPENPIPAVDLHDGVRVEEARRIYEGLDENTRRRLELYTANRDFSPPMKLYYFWRGVGAMSDPLYNLCLLGCAVIPMIPIEGGSSGSKFATSICAVASIVLGKIGGYAENKIAHYENLQILLHAAEENPLFLQHHPGAPAGQV
ncbi:MAG: hypothetical protein LBB25_04560 [Holosporaceae bacterium]|nr:hypothetical protein [Holosporaceae bacterium]